MDLNTNPNNQITEETGYTMAALGISALGLTSAVGALLTQNQLPLSIPEVIHNIFQTVAILSTPLSMVFSIRGGEIPAITRSENIRLTIILNFLNYALLGRFTV